MEKTKTVILEVVIPSIERMILAEEKHLEYLHERKRDLESKMLNLNKLQKVFLSDYKENKDLVESFIHTSEKYLSHFRERLKEYTEYVKNLEK